MSRVVDACEREVVRLSNLPVHDSVAGGYVDEAGGGETGGREFGDGDGEAAEPVAYVVCVCVSPAPDLARSWSKNWIGGENGSENIPPKYHVRSPRVSAMVSSSWPSSPVVPKVLPTKAWSVKLMKAPIS